MSCRLSRYRVAFGIDHKLSGPPQPNQRPLSSPIAAVTAWALCEGGLVVKSRVPPNCSIQAWICLFLAPTDSAAGSMQTGHVGPKKILLGKAPYT
eukprot:899270-Pelagomonas_calceolata.AAC.1